MKHRGECSRMEPQPRLQSTQPDGTKVEMNFLPGDKESAYMCICNATVTHKAHVRGIMQKKDSNYPALKALMFMFTLHLKRIDTCQTQAIRSSIHFLLFFVQ